MRNHTRRRDAARAGRFRLYARGAAQQHGDPQDRSVDLRRHGAEPRPLRPFRRNGRLSQANKGKLKGRLPFYVGGEDAFCLRKNPGGNFGALDRKAIMDADLALMLSEGPAVVADHAFTTGRIGQTSFEKPLLPTQEIVGIFDGFGCFPEKMPAAKKSDNTSPTISTTRSDHLHGQGQRTGGAHLMQPPRRHQRGEGRRSKRPASTRCTR